MNELLIKPIPSDAKKVFEGKIFSVWQWEQECFDGSLATFERLSRHDYAHVIGVLPDKRIMLIEDEQPDRGPVLTPAGGGLEKGEHPEIGAQREFLEETGYTARELIPWYSYRPNNKIEMIAHAFIGRHSVKTQEPKLEAGEKVKPLFFTFEQFLQLGQDSSLRDLFLRIKLLEAQLDPIKKQELSTLLYGN